MAYSFAPYAIKKLAWELARRARLAEDLIAPVNQPVLWVCQLPRYGGTMLARLFDNHPQLHVIPKPVAMDSPHGAAWPDEAGFSFERIRKILDMSALNGTFLHKKASNTDQAGVPIYFDPVWYRRICRTWKLEDQSENEVRTTLAVLFTAHFNAWRNYQNLYGDNRYVVVQTAVGGKCDLELSYRNFRSVYPDGHWIFSFRPPEDWLASISRLKRSAGAELESVEDAIDVYRRVYEGAAGLIGREGFIALDFPGFLRGGKETALDLARRIGCDPHPALLQTTMNSVHMNQNSSHAVAPRAAVDPSRAGAGRKMVDEFAAYPGFGACVEIYEECRAAIAKAETHLK